MKRVTHTLFSDWLKSKGLTVPGLAKALGVTRSAVYGWASGTFTPTLPHLIALHRFSEGEVSLETFVTVDERNNTVSIPDDGSEAVVSSRS